MRGNTSTDFSLTIITHSITSSMSPHYRNSQTPPTTNGETVPPPRRALPYVKGVSELIARHHRTFNFAHNPTKSLQGILVKVKDPLPTLKQRNVVHHTPCSDCPNAYVGQTGRQLSAGVKEHKGAVKRPDEISLRALHYLSTGHAFDCTTGFAIIGGDEGRSRAQSVNILTSARRNTTTPPLSPMF